MEPNHRLENAMQSCDDELMKQIKRGDMRAFDILAAKWQRQLFNFVHRFVGEYELAEDVCQEVLLRVYQRAEQYKPRNQFKTWLYRIAINCSIDEMRRLNRHRMFPLKLLHRRENEEQQEPEVALADPAPQPDEVARLNEIARHIQDALRRLPDKQRAVIVMRHYEGLNFREIASILGCPLSTVKSRMSRGLERMQAVLKHSLLEGGALDEV